MKVTLILHLVSCLLTALRLTYDEDTWHYGSS
jgi:hypothetical protein